MPSFGRQNVRQELKSARITITRSQASQSQSPTPEGSPQPIYLGDLGHFCEEVARTWETPTHESTSNDERREPTEHSPKFAVRPGRDYEILYCLQDAFEVPYWEFMLDLFLQRRAHSTALSGEVVLRVLDSVKLELLDERCQLWNEVGLLSPHDRDDISPVLKGIEARVKVLESVWDGPTSKLYQKHFFLKETAFKPSRNIAAAVAEEPPRGLGDEPGRHPTVRYTFPTPLTTLLISLRRKQWHLLPLFSSSSPQPSSRGTRDLGYRCKAIPREARTTPTFGILFKTASWLFWATSPWLCLCLEGRGFCQRMV